MATVVNFKNKRIIEPGVYAQVKSKVPVSPSDASYGNVCIIDTGSGASWGGGSGVDGELANNLGSVYGFANVNDFKDFVRGGLLWDIADYLFNPAPNAQGIDTLYIVRAATTVTGAGGYVFTGGGANGGSFNFKTKNEGLSVNGYLDETLAKAIFVLSGVVTIGDSISFYSDATLLGTFVTLSTSLSAARNGIINAINTLTGTHGFTAVLVGTDVVVYAPDHSGAAANLFVPSTVVVGTTVATTGLLFAGGVTGTKIIKGYGYQLKAGIIDPLKYIVEFYEGTWRGYDADGDDFGGINKADSVPNLIARSAEFDNIETLILWAKADFAFSQRFVVVDATTFILGSGLVDGADFTANSALKRITGGTETYSSANIDKVLKSITELDNTFFLADRYGDEAKGVQNNKILAHIVNDAEFEKFMVIGGGLDETKFTGTNGSIDIAQTYDTQSVIVCHSGFKINKLVGSGFKNLTAFYHAANYLGRLAGLEPQVPATFKAMRAKNFLHQLTKTEREQALQAGVVHNRFVPQIGDVINQSINTLQKNTQLINPDGSSFEVQIMRIAAQLNKELTLNLRPVFIGGNLNTSSPADVKTFIEGYLTFKTATKSKDNLILSFTKVTVRQIQDYYQIEYGFVPNGPVNKIFITGFILDGNLSA